MVAECIASFLVPYTTSVVQGVLPCLCNCCERCISKPNPGQEDQKKSKNTFVEQRIPSYLNRWYGKDELDALVKLILNRKQAIIAVTGPIGVGKTVLLQRFNNEFGSKGWWRSVDVVIFVSDMRRKGISVDDWIREVQNKIAKRLNITSWDDTGSNCNDRAEKITETLQWSNFVVIIDNVMPGARLQDLGIPSTNSSPTVQRKVVFSAWNISLLEPEWRISNVIELPKMDAATSWKLFSCTYQEIQLRLNDTVKRIARQAVHLFNGLPEPIIRLAHEMVVDGERLKRWQDYVESCTSSTNMLMNPVDGLTRSLDVLLSDILTRRSLDKNIFRPCFLFCSLFPSEHPMNTAELINYWMCEGLLGNESTPKFRKHCINSGEKIIQDLLDFHLLQSIDEDKEGVVKIPYVYQRAALEIAKQEDGEKTYASIGADAKTIPESIFSNCQQARRVSFINSDVEKLDDVSPDCPLLKTLIMSRNNKLCSVSIEFFSSMPNLQVLDLSHTAITEISAGIGALLSLRSLNVSFTDITRLPEEMTKLGNLENLHLEGTDKLQEIPEEVLSHLSDTLRVLKVTNSYNTWSSASDQDDRSGKAIYILNMEKFRQLEYLAITINSTVLQIMLLGSSKLTGFTKHLQLKGYRETIIDITSVLAQAPKLEELSVTLSDEVKELMVQENSLSTVLPDLKALFLLELHQVKVTWEVVTNTPKPLRFLSSLTISGCNKLEDVTWIVHIPRLKYMSISNCQELKTLVTENIQANIPAFSFLEKMTLQSLPNLALVCKEDNIFSFPLLVSMSIRNCSNLVKLPLPKPRPQKLKLIQGELSWWDNLNWGEKASMLIEYNPIFKPIDEVTTEGRSNVADIVCCSSSCC